MTVRVFRFTHNLRPDVKNMTVISVERQLRRPDYKRSLVFAIKARGEETLHTAEILLFHAILILFLLNARHIRGLEL
jgi:hypothetical protein